MELGLSKRDFVENIVGCALDAAMFVVTGGHHSGYCVFKTTENAAKITSWLVEKFERHESFDENFEKENEFDKFDYEYFTYASYPSDSDSSLFDRFCRITIEDELKWR